MKTEVEKDQDKLCIETWRMFIAQFNALWESGERKHEPYISLKEKAKINPHLNYRQRDAIISRCDNVMKNEYGNTKRDEHFDHAKPSAKK